MNPLDFILPLILLAITYSLKLFIDQVVDFPATIKSVCELPIDIVFLSISLLIAIAISNSDIRIDGIVYMLGNFVAAIIIVFLSKRSISNFTLSTANNRWKYFLSINMFISVMSLCISISMLKHLPVKDIKPIKTQTSKDGN